MTERAPPRRHGMIRLGDALPGLTTPAFKRHGFHEARLLRDWPAIIGEALAAQSRPERLTFPRDRKTDGALRIQATPGFALEMQHMEDAILERIAAYFGYRAVARLQIRQVFSLEIPAPARAPEPPRPAAPLPEETARQVNAIGNDALREALAALGAGVHGRRGG